MKIVKNSLWNMSAVIIPMIVALPALGIISRIIGVERFGLFTLIFALVGFASVFDLGLSRAVTREVAVNSSDRFLVKKIINTSSFFLLITSSFALIIFFYFNKSVAELLNVTTEVKDDLNSALLCAYFIIPVFLLTLVHYSLYEGMQLFSIVSKVRIVSNILLSIIPLLFVLYKPTLFSAVQGLLVSRVMSFLIIFYMSKKILNGPCEGVFDIPTLVRLLRFGGWVTVSNLISPLMNYFDRFVISNVSGASTVAYYTGPAEAVSKMNSIPSAISRALFPSIAASESNDFLKNMLFLAIVVLVMTLPIFFYSSEIMAFWLGSNFYSSGDIFKILLIGFVFNSLAQLPYTYIQANNRSDLTAFVHIIELLPYLVLLYYLVKSYGVTGAALAWLIRVFIDLIALTFTYRYIIRRAG